MSVSTDSVYPLGLWLATLLAMGGCASRSPGPRYGDVEEGPCRTDAECPSQHKCVQDRAHLQQGGEITGDLVTFRCEPDGEACRQHQLVFEQRAEHSRARACHADSECAAICGPRGGCPDETMVVHAADAQLLEGMAKQVLEACREAVVLDPAAGYSEVEARCVSGRCEELRTSVAPLNDEGS